MGIAGVIARAKKTVQAGGLPGIVGELSDTLRSSAIPVPLRSAAARIADLLGVPESPERVVVPLVPERPPHAVDAALNAAHGGVCPFTGHSATSLDAEPMPGAHEGPADESAPELESMRAVEVEAVADVVVAGLVAEASASAHGTEAKLDVAPEPRPAHKPLPSAESVAPSRTASASKSVPPSKPQPSKSPAAGTNTKAKSTGEKSRGDLAAKPSTAKTSARSSKGPTAKPSGAKKKKKK